MRIFAPFSGKFKYNKSHYPNPNEKYQSPRLILANINWHYDISTDEEYEYCIQNYDSLLAKKFELFDNKSDCIVENQASWDLEEDNIPSDTDNPELTKEGCLGKGVERLAWYASAHFNVCEDYGIHLIPEGIVHVAEILIQKCKNYDLNISRRMAVVWAMNILYCHELVHSWIEDIASIIEFSTGDDIYTKTQKKYNSYIFMEEALCNTAVFGLQRSFLNRDKYKHFETGRKEQAENDYIDYVKDNSSEFDKDKMLKALSDFMREQPKGYKDFLEIDLDPTQSFEFIRGVINLFKHIYQCDYKIEDDLLEAIDFYFGVSSHRVKYSKKIEKDAIDFTQNSRENLREEVPIRFEGVTK